MSHAAAGYDNVTIYTICLEVSSLQTRVRRFQDSARSSRLPVVTIPSSSRRRIWICSMVLRASMLLFCMAVFYIIFTVLQILVSFCLVYTRNISDTQ